LQELHATLLSGVRGRDRTPGEFRKLQNHIGAPGSTIDEASFVPPPPPEMISALNELELYLHTPSPLHTLVRAALVHYQFEAIHPFSDGNGRIGRLLIPLLLHNDRVLTRPLLYLSAYFERTREEYCRRLFEVSSEGRWLEWLVYFLKGVAGQARDALRRCQRLIELLDRYKETVEKPGRSALAVKLVEHLFEEPYLTIGEAAGALEIGFASATRLVMQLVGAGVLMEVTGQRRNRIFGAEEIVRLIEAELPEE
jgi:Fic family protein